MGLAGTGVTIEKAFRDARSRLKQSGIKTADLDASLLLEYACGATTLMRMTNPDAPMSIEQVRAFGNYVERRLAREPAHRIIGSREFYGLDFILNEATLVPRPDTEILVDAVLPFVHDKIAETGSCAVLDLGAGTGAIGLAILHEAPKATALGIDISARALEAAAINARALGLAGRYQTAQSNWFEDVKGQFDLIVSNPPYIASDVIENLEIDVRDHDPRAALDGGQDGLSAYAIIAKNADPYLKKAGRIAVEIGFDQKTSVSALFEAAGHRTIEARNDLNGLNRVLFFA